MFTTRRRLARTMRSRASTSPWPMATARSCSSSGESRAVSLISRRYVSSGDWGATLERRRRVRFMLGGAADFGPADPTQLSTPLRAFLQGSAPATRWTFCTRDDGGDGKAGSSHRDKGGNGPSEGERLRFSRTAPIWPRCCGPAETRDGVYVVAGRRDARLLPGGSLSRDSQSGVSAEGNIKSRSQNRVPLLHSPAGEDCRGGSGIGSKSRSQNLGALPDSPAADPFPGSSGIGSKCRQRVIAGRSRVGVGWGCGGTWRGEDGILRIRE